jgi:hypothetical protein
VQDERLTVIPNPLRSVFYENILNQLTEFPEIGIVRVVLMLKKKGMLGELYSSRLLADITNCPASLKSPFETTTGFYQFLVDSLETLDEIRRFGYDQVFGFNLSYFQYPVDYYGKILSLSAPYPWIRKNVLSDLKRSDHPRSLFYLAAGFYRSRNRPESLPEIDFVQTIKSRTNVEIGVENQKGRITFHPDKNDETAMLNYLIYWASAYQDYEFDENRNIFVSKLEAFSKTQNYERLFRRFNSKNDSIAMLAFLQLNRIGSPRRHFPVEKISGLAAQPQCRPTFDEIRVSRTARAADRLLQEE